MPGGLLCRLAGHWTPFTRTLPRDHVSGLGGRDWKNRDRSWALDQMFCNPGRGRATLEELIERLDPASRRERREAELEAGRRRTEAALQ